MALRSPAWRTALLLGLFTTGGCYAYRPVALAPAPRSRVRVVFTSALVLTTLPSGPDRPGRGGAGSDGLILIIIATITKGF